jgi:hypothetical protein
MTHALLSSEAHRGLRVRTEGEIVPSDAVMTCITVPDEFRRVQNEYLILFRRDPERDQFTALVMFGFEAGENLYVENGRWDATYRPLAMSIQPFLIGGAPGDAEAKQVHIDLAHARVANDGADGVRVFDDEGRPSPFLEAMIDRLGALDDGYERTADFFAALKRHDLLEPMSIDITLDDGATNRLVGFHVIDEDKLRDLESTALAGLHADGHLMPIFMALASIANLNALVARKNRRNARG